MDRMDLQERSVFRSTDSSYSKKHSPEPVVPGINIVSSLYII